MKKQISAADPSAVTGRKWSKNEKLNAILSEIEKELRGMCETEAESLCEIKRYTSEFPREIDYNLVQYGNLTVCNYEVRQMYIRAGYNCAKWGYARVWDMYKRHVGLAAREIVKETASVVGGDVVA